MRKIEIFFVLFIIVCLLFSQVFLVGARSDRSYNDLVGAFMDLEDDYPEYVSHESVGLTVEGRNIWMFKIGNPSGERVLFDGAIHGWENVGSEVLYLYARWLLSSGEEVADEILGGTYTLLIPALNIDSYNDTRKNSHGVDLNRNFASGWERSGSDNPSSEYYHGPSPLSEPESQALIGVFEEYSPMFYCNLHEGGIYYAGSTYGNITYYVEIVDKVNDFAEDHDIHPYYYQGEFRGGGLSISDAADMGIMSFIIELHDPHVPDNIETDVFPRFFAIAVVLGQEAYLESIDDVPPVTTSFYDGLWHNSSFVIPLSAQDGQSGVKDTYYRINGGLIRSVKSSGQPRITVEGSKNVLEFWSIDYRGNEESHTMITGIRMDKTPPTVELISDLANLYLNPDGEITILVNVIDSISGIENVTFSFAEESLSHWVYLPMQYNSTAGLYQASISPRSELTLNFEIEAFDKAGNKQIENNNTIPEYPKYIIFIIFIIMSVITVRIRNKVKS